MDDCYKKYPRLLQCSSDVNNGSGGSEIGAGAALQVATLRTGDHPTLCPLVLARAPHYRRLLSTAQRCNVALFLQDGVVRPLNWIPYSITQMNDSLDHTVLVSILGEHIQDGHFLHLVDELLKAGYLANWQYHATLSGAPQGSGVSPLLSNLYLAKLDKYVETELLPVYNRGTRRKFNPAYEKLRHRANYLAKRGRNKEAATMRKLSRTLPSIDPQDPDYRRLRYLRYADDWLLGFCGPREEAEAIKHQLRMFLCDELKLELSESKTLITHARTQAARFLGYEIEVIHEDHLCDQTGRRSANGNIGLQVPVAVARDKCRLYIRHGKPTPRVECMVDTDFSIIAQYQQEFRGIVEYYRLAYNLAPQLTKLKWVMEQSLTKTLVQPGGNSPSILVPLASDPSLTLIRRPPCVDQHPYLSN